METLTDRAVAASPDQQENGCMTFREAAKKWMKDATTRSRRPIRLTSLPTIKSALEKYAYPHIGSLEISRVNNKACLPVVEAMKKAKLSSSTMDSYFGHIKSVVAHEIDPDTGEPKYLRKWSAKYLDLPVVEYSKTPMITGKEVEHMLEHSRDGWEHLLYLVLASTGMRVSEVLALEWENVVNGYRTIRVVQQLDRYSKVVKYLKTKSGKREVDVSADVAFWLETHGNGETGLVFKTRNGKPYRVNNLERRRLREFVSGGFHQFRRFRNTHLRSPKVNCQEDLRKFWLGHAPAKADMGEIYSKLSRDLDVRLAEAERVGLGFEVRPMRGGERPSIRKYRSDRGKIRSPRKKAAIAAMKKRLAASGIK